MKSGWISFRKGSNEPYENTSLHIKSVGKLWKIVQKVKLSFKLLFTDSMLKHYSQFDWQTSWPLWQMRLLNDLKTCQGGKTWILFSAFHTAVQRLISLVFKVNVPLYGCLTVSKFVNSWLYPFIVTGSLPPAPSSCGSGSELTQAVRQQAGDWLLIEVHVVERPLELCGISGSAKLAGQGSLGCS